MDTEGNKKSGFDRRNGDPVNYQSPSVSSGWRNPEQMTSGDNSMVVCRGDLVEASLRSSASMVNSFGQGPWQHHSNLQNLGYPVTGFQNNASSSNTPGLSDTPGNSKQCHVPFGSGVDRTLDMDWVSPSLMLKGGPFLPNVTAVVPQSLTQLPADSGFIERAARFSCFNNGHFSDMVNPFGSNEFMGVFPRGGGLLQWQQEAFSGNGMKSVSIENYHRNDINTCQASSKGISLSVDHGSTEGSPLKNEREGDVRTQDEAMVAADRSVNESDEGESNGKVGQVDASVLEGADGQSTSKGVGPRKRKRTAKEIEVKEVVQQSEEVAKNCAENQQKEEQNPSPTTNKTSGKQEYQELQASDSQKEQYIHVRARRGQATNSHSLAERLRREKISQRMKFLQDLVPGCSKVTGKAVMLDEIINYVQSLQRQVEFLSMKLATVNPRLDFNIEGLFSKEILQPQAGPSYTPGFLPEVPMHYPPGQPTQAGLVQPGLHDMGTSSDVLHRAINPPYAQITAGFKDPSQLARMWEDGLQNVVRMGLGAGDPSSGE